MTLRKASIALVLTVAALAATSSLDSASAQVGIGYILDEAEIPTFQRAPQPSQNSAGAAPRPSNRDMGYAPVVPDNIGPKTMPNYSQLDRVPRLGPTSRSPTSDIRGSSAKGGMRGGMGGDRVNGGMGQR
jgi:hypothetical protein